MAEAALQAYLNLTPQEIRRQLVSIQARQMPAPGRRQVPFTAIETLLCYGLFSLVDPHRYGGRNIDTAPAIVGALATFFRRSPTSITSKMLNLDGSWKHSAHEEPRLFAFLATYPERFTALYTSILLVARDLSLDEQTLPDFLQLLAPSAHGEALLGQEELPASLGQLLSGAEQQLKQLELVFHLSEPLTEKLVERKIRLAQHRFAQHVLENCGHTCVFCGFAPRSLPPRSGFLHASHIKPWAVSDAQERLDVHNGLAACPMHDTAFDRGFLTVEDGSRIAMARSLQESIAHDQGVALYFSGALHPTLLLPPGAQLPETHYLHYHRTHIFLG